MTAPSTPPTAAPDAGDATRPGSLARRLARTLILWVGCVWLLCVLGVTWYVDQEISANFDSELVEVSHRMFDIALEHLDDAPAQPANGAPLTIPSPGSFADADVLYQLVTPGARVLAHSAKAVALQVSFDVPLATGFANTGDWRIYTIKHPSRPIYLQVADPLSERRAALNRTLGGLIATLCAALPLLAWLLARIARRELRVLYRLAHAIGQRDGQQLAPIALAGLPRELQHMQAHINRLLERLRQALDVERSLAANAAHELRTPLAAARLRLQTALDHGLDRGEVQAAVASLDTLAQRTDKLLQLSRAQSSAPLARERVPLVQLATTVAQEFWRDETHADRLELVSGTDEPPPVTLGDFDALAIALRNLVENALRYAAGASVEILVGPGCTLTVRDHGPGVPPAQLQTLQQRHVRHHSDHAGYGLGLSIVATIVHKHGGQLRLDSPLPGGSPGLQASMQLLDTSGRPSAPPAPPSVPAA
ncbi:HAMP domain-containing sensor histidine kinase [Comamonas faecalis]|uniref:histidine kinase n=1 Tax=Comamonas faecalis TaxID=1387849 RepID=A0ABP7RMI4_9BURK